MGPSHTLVTGSPKQEGTDIKLATWSSESFSLNLSEAENSSYLPLLREGQVHGCLQNPFLTEPTLLSHPMCMSSYKLCDRLLETWDAAPLIPCVSRKTPTLTSRYTETSCLGPKGSHSTLRIERMNKGELHGSPLQTSFCTFSPILSKVSLQFSSFLIPLAIREHDLFLPRESVYRSQWLG